MPGLASTLSRALCLMAPRLLTLINRTTQKTVSRSQVHQEQTDLNSLHTWTILGAREFSCTVSGLGQGLFCDLRSVGRMIMLTSGHQVMKACYEKTSGTQGTPGQSCYFGCSILQSYFNLVSPCSVPSLCSAVLLWNI